MSTKARRHELGGLVWEAASRQPGGAGAGSWWVVCSLKVCLLDKKEPVTYWKQDMIECEVHFTGDPVNTVVRQKMRKPNTGQLAEGCPSALGLSLKGKDGVNRCYTASEGRSAAAQAV